MKKLMPLSAALLVLLPLVAGTADAKTRIFVAINRDDDRFVNIVRSSVEAEAAKDPDIELTVVNADNNGATQVEQIQKIVGKTDVIMVLTVDDATARDVARITAGKTPLIYLNRRPPIDRFTGQVAIVSSNDLVAGRLQMRLIADKIGNTGNVVILRGEDGHPAAIERTQGVKEILAQKPNIRLVKDVSGNWDRGQAEKLVTNWLASGEKIDAILANNDEMAVGAIAALQKAGIKPGVIPVAGVDGTSDALAAIKSGYLTLSLLQNAKAQGAQALADAKKFAGKQYAELYDWVPYELIVPANVDAFAGQ